MATLREIGIEYQMLLNLMLDDEVDTETVMDTLEGIHGELEDKAECCLTVMSELGEKAEMYEKESKRLAAAAKVMKNNAGRIKDNLEWVMNQNGLKKLETKFHKLTIQKNPDAVALDVIDVNLIPEEYRVPQPDKVDKKKILADLKARKELDFAHITSGSSLRVR